MQLLIPQPPHTLTTALGFSKQLRDYYEPSSTRRELTAVEQVSSDQERCARLQQILLQRDRCIKAYNHASRLNVTSTAHDSNWELYSGVHA